MACQNLSQVGAFAWTGAPPDPPLEIFLGPMVIVMVIVHAHGQPVLGAKIWKKMVNISYKLRVVLGWAKLDAKIAG